MTPIRCSRHEKQDVAGGLGVDVVQDHLWIENLLMQLFLNVALSLFAL